MMNKGDGRIMYGQDLGKIDGLDEYVEKRTKEKDEIIEDYRAENKRLNDVIINLHDDIGRCKQKIKMQDHIIDTQQDIINAFCELVGMINDKE